MQPELLASGGMQRLRLHKLDSDSWFTIQKIKFTFTADPKLMPHVLGAICGLLLPDESWHCPLGNKIQAPCLLVGPWWPGLLPRGPAWLGPITGLWWWGGWALPVTQIWIRCLRWYKTNPGLVIYGSSSGKKSVHSVDSSGRLTSHFGHITDLMRDKWSGARSSRCLCRLAWQTWLLHRFICLWFSHHSGRGKAELTQRTGAFFSDQSLK